MPTADHPVPRMETGMTTTQGFLGAITALMIAASTNAQSAASPPAAVTIVLVHGALIDGSSWRAVSAGLARAANRAASVSKPRPGPTERVPPTHAAPPRRDARAIPAAPGDGDPTFTVAGPAP